MYVKKFNETSSLGKLADSWNDYHYDRHDIDDNRRLRAKSYTPLVMQIAYAINQLLNHYTHRLTGRRNNEITREKNIYAIVRIYCHNGKLETANVVNDRKAKHDPSAYCETEY